MPKHKGPRLTWSGNLRAEQEAEEAFRKLKDKPKSSAKRTKQSDRHKKRKRSPRKRVVGFRERGAESWASWYSAYIASPAWRQKRLDLFAKVGRKCSRCGDDKNKIQVHHKTYQRVGRERLSDLEPLCELCHSLHHNKELKVPDELKPPRF